MCKIHKIIVLIIHAIALNLLFTSDVYAYFDQGTGSLLIQSTIAFFGIMMVYLHRIKATVTAFFHKFFLKRKPKPSHPDDI